MTPSLPHNAPFIVHRHDVILPSSTDNDDMDDLPIKALLLNERVLHHRHYTMVPTSIAQQ